jgi:hypothetical protein
MMKVEIGLGEHDGFVKYFLFRFESGLVLKSHHHSLPFIGQAGRQEVIAQVNALADQFEKDGHEVVGRELIARAS